jgi:predicted ATPase/DNA-binding winged helix-turn-helix (wHTH) protein
MGRGEGEGMSPGDSSELDPTPRDPGAAARRPEQPAIIEFGRFSLARHQRELLADGRPVVLGGRAFDTLMALIDARGLILSKDELMRRVWPDRVVEENNLEAQISALRKVFGTDRDLIRTIAGRGYQFTGDIRATAARVALTLPRMTNLPEGTSELIGREVELSDVANLVTRHRLVTLIGAGGIGKTRLGLETARSLLPRFPNGVFLADLAPLSSPELVPATVGAALGLTLVGTTVSRESVAAAVSTTQLLLVLDNCEHMIEAAAGMADALLRANPNASLLATSREPLRTDGEYLYRVPSLAVPTEGNRDVEDVLRHGAVKLFVSRAQAADPRYTSDARLAETMAAICRHLDGIPLAIELAASRVAAFGVEGIAARLDDRFRLLTGGRRTALPRHQTLRATLDWSYELLSEPERVVLRRLAVFVGVFTLEAASAVAASVDVPAPDVLDCVETLVGKSLLSADVAGAPVRYRLLETTRAYAREKLGVSGELEPFARRHAEYHRDLFERAEAEWETLPTAEWLAAYAYAVDDVRAALDWAFSPDGDQATGMALTIASIPLWLQLSLWNDFLERAQQACASHEAGLRLDARLELKLYAGLAVSLVNTRAHDATWARVLEMAETLDDTDYQLRALWGLWVACINLGKFGEALALANRFRSTAERSDVRDRAIGERLIGASLHFVGDQSSARKHIMRMLNSYVTRTNRSDIVRFQFDQRVTARITLARVLWLQGFADDAMRTIESNIDEALSISHTLSLCNTLAQAACPVALYAGDLAAAERFIAMLLDPSRHALKQWHAYGRCFKGMLLIKRGDINPGLHLLGPAVNELREAQFVQFHSVFLGWLAEGYAAAGQVVPGLSAIGEALTRAEQTQEGWATAELLRIKGELLLRENGPRAAVAAAEHFEKAIDLGRRQEALAWELRGAMSLARLWHGQRRTSQARNLLAPIYRRFTQGFGTADLMDAKALLAALR